jgi:hypothetical protein
MFEAITAPNRCLPTLIYQISFVEILPELLTITAFDAGF